MTRRIHPPVWLKRWLLPTWNGGYRLARRTREVLEALLAGRVERCVVCGRFGLMLYRRRVIPPELARRWGLTPRVAKAVARKESLDCSRCGAKLRARRLASVLLTLDPATPEPRSLRDWVGMAETRTLRVAEINRIDGIHETLSDLPLLQSSDFVENAPPGSLPESIRSEDLTALSYEAASFDLVLTSESLEHVPDLARALAEIHRVLAPGGRHVFTIPLLPGVPATFSRARLDPQGGVVELAPAIFHPGGDVGYRVFTEFGADAVDIFRAAGFEVETRFGPVTEDDVAQVYVARKR